VRRAVYIAGRKRRRREETGAGAGRQGQGGRERRVIPSRERRGEEIRINESYDTGPGQRQQAGGRGHSKGVRACRTDGWTPGAVRCGAVPCRRVSCAFAVGVVGWACSPAPLLLRPRDDGKRTLEDFSSINFNSIV
jgi:hypothetical protein